MPSRQFSKYSGCGNDFVLIDNRSGDFPINHPDYIHRLCQRHQGIGADGVILLESSVACDGKMRIFNSDGYEAEMCGNGLRCLAQFMNELGFPKKYYTIETMLSDLSIDYVGEHIKTTMGTPSDLRLNLQLTIDEIPLLVHYLNTGVPHAVCFVDDIEKAKVFSLGRSIRMHPEFASKGANANFVQLISPTELSIRTYERGVENETLACGTGAAAAAIIAACQYHLNPPLQVKTRSGDILIIDFDITASGEFIHVTQTGPAKKNFSGIIEL